MKNITKKFFIIIFLLWAMYAFAAPNPPSPGSKKFPPPPPGLPIDESVDPVFILALLYGIYIIYNNQLKAKTPI